MKRALILSLFLIASTNCLAQWYPQNSGTTDGFRQIQFVNSNTGWVLAGTSKIYKSTNGGIDWALQYTGSVIISFFFLNENAGWIIERPWGKIYKTSNGGDNWNLIADISCSEPWSLNFINQDTGWMYSSVCLDGYKLFKTTNSGNTWAPLQISSDNIINMNYSVIDESNIMVTAANSDFVYSIFKTTDGGINWSSNLISMNGNAGAVHFVSPQIGWIKVNSDLYKTTNSGGSWILQAQSVNAYNFLNVNTGWYSSGSSIYRTTNGGANWIQQNSNTTNSITSLFFLDENKGWAVGENGTILSTINGGIPVELVSFNADVNNNSVLLNWSTATETNNRGFDVERKINDEWNSLAFIEGHGTTTEITHYSYTDNLFDYSGLVFYRLKQIDYDGSFEYSKEIEVEIGMPEKFILYQNYPNPFNPATKIKYAIPDFGFTSLKIYDVLGNEIVTLVNEEKQPGEYEVEFSVGSFGDGSNLSSGIYFYTLNAGSFRETKKMILLR
jgi:photosystem II stability/assembly factor-like uncharacterized protein